EPVRAERGHPQPTASPEQAGKWLSSRTGRQTVREFCFACLLTVERGFTRQTPTAPMSSRSRSRRTSRSFLTGLIGNVPCSRKLQTIRLPQQNEAFSKQARTHTRNRLCVAKFNKSMRRTL